MRIRTSDIRPGDIILCRPKQLQGETAEVSEKIGIPYTHACICTSQDKLAHAAVTGVRYNQIRALMRTNRNLAVFRSLNPWSQLQLSRLNMFVDKSINRSLQFSTQGIYDFCDAKSAHDINVVESFFQQSALPIYSFESDEVFCSEFVAQCCAMAGRLSDEVTLLYRPDVQSPHDIVSNSAFASILVGYVYEDGEKVCNDDPFRDKQTWADLMKSSEKLPNESEPVDEFAGSFIEQINADVNQFNSLVETDSLKIQNVEKI